MKLELNIDSMEDYRTFLAVRRLPIYRIGGDSCRFPDEYAGSLGLPLTQSPAADYVPSPFLFDYQAATSRIAIAKRKFAAFIRCGLGKTLVLCEFMRHASRAVGLNRNALVVAPLMVIPQTIEEASKFYGGELRMEQIASRDLQSWLKGGCGIGITNYESLNKPLEAGRLGVLGVDESSTLKGQYGTWSQNIIDLGRGLEWILALTGTPAPNDRIEYANHAVLLGAARTQNEFLARYFVNRGQTQNRWEMRPHALKRFYRDLSHWCIFLDNPGTYGFKDNAGTIPPIHVHMHHVDLTPAQRKAVQREIGGLFVSSAGGIGSRSVLSQIAKGSHRGKPIETLKPQFIRELVASWPSESTIVWCKYNDEQDAIARAIPDAENIDGRTSHESRMESIRRFKSRESKVLVSKADILGFGLNLQVATRHVFSGLQDSYEDYHQCVSRSNRVGSTEPLHVHIPMTEIEEPMVQNVLRKAARVQQDTEEQEAIFKAERLISWTC